jgi:hypothetical protein
MAKGNAMVKELLTIDEDDPRVAEPAASVAVVPQQPASLTPATVPPADAVTGMFERLAKDPNVDVVKLERLIEMQERILAYNAKAEYYTAFAAMQGELPTVEERGSTNNGNYALHEDIVEAVRPVLQKHGFILTHRTQFPDASTVRVIGILAHRGGHAEETEFLSEADTSGNKNAIQALGSAQSYGQRYTARALLNIASRKSDDDGVATGPKPKPEKPAPEGYDAWLAVIDGIASNGDAVFEKAWADSKPEHRKYLIDTAPKLLAGMRTKARKAGK